MEKFKECEKDMKVKSFSKLGLDRAAKQDPHQLAVEERSEWLKQTVDRLNNMVRGPWRVLTVVPSVTVSNASVRRALRSRSLCTGQHSAERERGRCA